MYLYTELQNLDVHPVLVQWIKSFLTEREQCVRIGKFTSSWKKINGGLPQGTKLGPLLFAVLVNSLLSNWQGRMKFVDDTSALEIVPRCSPSLLPVVVNEVNNFATDRGMKLNPKKCREMLISFLKYSLSNFDTIHISGMPVEKVPSYKLLGLILSEYLTWNSHIDYILKKANSRLYALRQLKKAGLSQHDLILIYCSFIRSCVEYASPAWSDLTVSLAKLIESVQKRALYACYTSCIVIRRCSFVYWLRNTC